MNTTTVIILLVALLFSAFFSGIEIAYLSSNKLFLELDKNKKSLTGNLLNIFYKQQSNFITSLLVGNNIALVVYGIQMARLMTPALTQIITNDPIILLLQIILSTLLILFTGEFLPKMIFRINPNLSLRFFAIPLFIIYIILYPIARFTSLVAVGLLRLFGIRINENENENVFGRVDLDHFIQQTIKHASDNSDMDTEVKIFQNALDFSNVRIRNCMVPRPDMVSLDLASSLQEVTEKFIETGLSKIIIYDKEIDNIVGYVHSLEMFKRPGNWTTAINPLPIVPETMAANKLMRIFMQQRKSIAVVVDEFGGTSGIVTLEDIFEEIFGDFEDEHDINSLVAKKNNEGEYILSGRLEVHKMNEIFDLNFPESDKYATIGGYILYKIQRFPKPNEIFELDNYHFKTLKVTNTKIELIKMSIAPLP